MKLTYLGTAAAEGWPAVFCNCDYCLKAKELGGKNIRTRSQSLINDDLLIEFNGDTYYHALNNNIDLSKIKFCFITHSHLDHFQPTDLVFRTDGVYAHKIAVPTLQLFGSKDVIARYEKFRTAVSDEPIPQMEINEVFAYQTVRAGDYEVTPLPANHAMEENAFVYLIKGDKTLLYLHDTGKPFREVYDYLEKNKIRADLISYDCTYVALPSGERHMGLDTVPEVMARLSEIGVADEKTTHIVNHFSHNGKLLHEELCKEADKIGCLCSFDGMTIDI